MAIEPGEIRARLTEIDWGDGLTREEIARQVPDLSADLFDQLPPNYFFADAGSVMSYLRHILDAGVVPAEVRDVVGDSGQPLGYGDAATGQTIVLPDDEHGVGSGAGSGYTGLSAQTGEDRDGVPYTDAGDGHAPTVSDEVILPTDVADDDPRTRPGPVRRSRVSPERPKKDTAA